jgi:hypothetical protein
MAVEAVCGELVYPDESLMTRENAGNSSGARFLGGPVRLVEQQRGRVVRMSFSALWGVDEEREG